MVANIEAQQKTEPWVKLHPVKPDLDLQKHYLQGYAGYEG